MGPSKLKMLLDTVIVRLGGEIGIKSPWTRRMYQKRLIENIKATLKRYNIAYDAVIYQQGRICIKTRHTRKATTKLTKVFGISSLSPASQTTNKLEDITMQSLSLAAQTFQRGNSFAVKCKRVGTHPYKSREVCQQVGRRILEAFPKLQLKVDLTNPEATLGVEIREDQSFIFTETITAPDGLPIGTQPKAITIIEPDLNSPVACWLTMKRGCPPVPVYFSQNQNKTAIKQVKKICKALFEWSIGHPTKLYIVAHSRNLATLKQGCPPHLLDIINKRLIYRLATYLAEKERAEAIVTGETICEKPHQTLRQFKLQDQAIQDYPIHRPLTGLTNTEIRKLAQEIGIQKAILTRPKKPEAAKLREAVLPTPKEVEAAESKLDMQKMINATLPELEATTI